MHRLNSLVSPLSLAVLALWALSACGGNSNGSGSNECGDCRVPPAPICDAVSGERVTFVPPGRCQDGVCMFPEARSTCDFGCVDGECSNTPPECDPNPCTEPPASTCDGNVLVQSLVPGTCTEGPSCRYQSQRVDCGDDVCFDGECRPRDCTFIECNVPPANSCDGDVAVQFAPLGTCDPQTLECSYQEQRDDCSARGESCVGGTCVDPCDGLSCTVPPPANCDGEVAVQYADIGACSEGVCAYEETREDCGAVGDVCEAGLCVPACVDASCLSPPLPTCSEDGRERIAFASVGACDETDTCVYAETVREDCTLDNLVCIDGACVDDPLCDGVDCSVPPVASACEAAVAVTFGAGLCVAGECNFARIEVDCGAAGLLCTEGTCVDRCAIDGCTSPPDAYCEGEAAVVYGARGTCDSGEGCTYPTFVDDCAARGLTCEAGVCIDTGCDCSEPPDIGFCDGNVRMEYVTPGFCEEDECLYKTAIAEDCTDSGSFCVLGECVPACPDEPCTPPAIACDGDEVVEYLRAGVCGEDDTCSFSASEVRTDCRAEGLACVDGACVDACEFLVCDVLPDPVCDGDVAVLPSFPSACVDSACEYSLTRLDCTLTGDVCFEGACVEPCIGVVCDNPPADECIDGVAVAYRDIGRCEAGACVYGSDDLDCTLEGGTCRDGECVDSCLGVVCDDVPVDGCDGDVLVTYSGESACVAGECVYLTSSVLDCAEFDLVCEADLCVDPCAGVVCDAPPASTCDGDIARVAAASGSCDAGVCAYDVTDVDCSALGGACESGACVDDCTNVVCEERTEAGCEGTLSFAYSASLPTCLGGECFYDRIEQDCADAGLGCFDGACGAIADICTQLTCPQPADFCDDGESVRFAGDGVCDAGNRACDFSAVETRVSCAAGTSCVAGVCRAAPAPGDVLFTEVFADARGSDAVAGDWVELWNATSAELDLSGSVLTTGIGGQVVLPTGTTLAAGAALVVGSAGTYAPDVAVDFFAFSIPNQGTTVSLTTEGVVIDSIDVDLSYGIVEGRSIELLEAARTSAADNDTADAWCVSAAVFDGPTGAIGTPGTATTVCAVP